MKPAHVLIALAVLVAAPAAAQNAGQIDRVRHGANCPGCNLFQADLGGLELRGRNFAGARLRQADLQLSVMNRANFAGGDLRDINAFGAVMSGANFARANLTNASFVGAYLQGANFTGAHLEGVNFSGAEMDHAVGLSPRALAGACGDAATTLPHGLRLRPCA